MTQATKDLPIGYRLPAHTFELTRENIAAFHLTLSDVQHGRAKLGPNIHTDPEFARSVGLPDVIADGSQTSAEISRFMTEFFGEGFLRGGSLYTKYIKPVYPGYALSINLVVNDRSEEGDAVRYDMDLTCTNQEELPVIVGRATAWAR
ncbi:MAG: MaoC family dehydratase [Dehalococcoidia bacterium]